MSEDSAGNEANEASSSPSISADGRYVAFESIASNLVAADSNNKVDIFVHDRDADGNGILDEPGPVGVSTVRVSVDSLGGEGNEDSSSASMSADGRYVAFESIASDLVAGDSNNKVDIFVHDRDADGNGTYDEPGAISTVRVSEATGGGEGNGDSSSASIADDGRYVAFESDADNLVAGDTNSKPDVFVHDRQTGATTRVSVDLAGVQGNGNSNAPSMSADGSSVTFQSDADNLVAGDTNIAPDIFADDLQAAAGGVGGGGSSSGGGGCFIATAADGSGMAGEK
jgi:Tol biopolymer transport system component